MTLKELIKTYDEIKGSVDFERKIDICNQIIKLDPNDFIAFNNRGNAYSELREYNKAIEDYNQAIKFNSEDAEAFYNRGITYEELGEYNKAIEDYNKAIEINSEYFEAFNNRGNAYVKLIEYNKAIEDYNKSIEINSENDEAFYNRGNVYAKLREYNKAIEDYNKTIEINSEDIKAFYNRGNAYVKLGKYDKAIEDYNKAIEINSDDAKVFYNRGITNRKLGNEEEAIEDFKKVNEIDPSIIVQEGTKDLKKEIKDTQSFQAILEELEEGHQKDAKIWMLVSVCAIIFTMSFLLIFGNTNVYFYTFYMFFSIITFTIIRQYTNAKALRIEAKNRVAMAKMFEKVKNENDNYRKELLPKLAEAIAYSTIKEKNSNGLAEKIIDILDKLKK